MKLTETLDKDILEFERLTGSAISSGAIPLIHRLAATGDHFERLGTEDAAAGRIKRTQEDFIQWGKERLPYPPERNDPIVDLMYKCYLSGYSAVAEVSYD